jgi:PAS fold.
MNSRSERSETPIVRAIDGTLSDGYLSLNTAFEVVSCNARAREQFGLGESDVVGESLWEICPSYDDTAAQQTLETALTTATQRSFESYSPTEAQWITVRVYPTDDGLTLISVTRSDSPAEYQQELFFDSAGEAGVSTFPRSRSIFRRRSSRFGDCPPITS